VSPKILDRRDSVPVACLRIRYDDVATKVMNRTVKLAPTLDGRKSMPRGEN